MVNLMHDLSSIKKLESRTWRLLANYDKLIDSVSPSHVIRSKVVSERYFTIEMCGL